MNTQLRQCVIGRQDDQRDEFTPLIIQSAMGIHITINKVVQNVCKFGVGTKSGNIRIPKQRVGSVRTDYAACGARAQKKRNQSND